MKKALCCLVLTLALGAAFPSRADTNLVNINLGSPDGRRLTDLYGKAYGFTPELVAPAMLSPAEEVPSILKIAQAAGTIPLNVWMMRKMGMNYGQIVSNFALGPTMAVASDPLFIQSNQTSFLRDVLQVPAPVLPTIPMSGVNFSRAILYPFDPIHGFWLPPGIAQKYGYRIPPGQITRVGWIVVPGSEVVVYPHEGWKEKKWKHKKFKGHKFKGWY